MHILITGGTGFIGQALLPALAAGGHSITLLSRQDNPLRGRYESVRTLEEIPNHARVDAVINLAGASMAGKRWSKSYKQELLDSRIGTTEALVGLLSRLDRAPVCFLSASAIGYYGHHGDEVLDERGEIAPGFAQSLCAQWEEEAAKASQWGARTCLMRLGVVLDSGGGAFEQMATPFKLGVGNWIGSGRQWLSWIHRDDVVAAIQFLLEHTELSGPFNLTAPESVTSRGFCDAMKRHKRTFISVPMPAPVMRVLVGEMADELLINGQRVAPEALLEAGFVFRYGSIDSALEAIWRD